MLPNSGEFGEVGSIFTSKFKNITPKHDANVFGQTL
jgi:hypothetical protein